MIPRAQNQSNGTSSISISFTQSSVALSWTLRRSVLCFHTLVEGWGGSFFILVNSLCSNKLECSHLILLVLLPSELQWLVVCFLVLSSSLPAGPSGPIREVQPALPAEHFTSSTCLVIRKWQINVSSFYLWIPGFILWQRCNTRLILQH